MRAVLLLLLAVSVSLTVRDHLLYANEYIKGVSFAAVSWQFWVQDAVENAALALALIYVWRVRQ